MTSLIESLPNEIIIEIIKYIPTKELLKICSLNKNIANIIYYYAQEKITKKINLIINQYNSMIEIMKNNENDNNNDKNILYKKFIKTCEKHLFFNKQNTKYTHIQYILLKAKYDF